MGFPGKPNGPRDSSSLNADFTGKAPRNCLAGLIPSLNTRRAMHSLLQSGPGCLLRAPGPSDQAAGPVADEGVQARLVADRRLLAVPGEDEEVPRQGQEAGLDRPDEVVPRPTWEVRPPDGTPEERVSREEDGLVAFEAETDAARRVTWGVDDLQGTTPARDPVPVSERAGHGPGGLDGDPEHPPPPREVAVQRKVPLVHQDRRSRLLRQPGRGEAVVEVCVRVDESDGAEPEPRESFEDPVRLAAGIEDDRRAGDRVRHDGAVAAERGDRKGLHEDEAHRTRVCHTHSGGPAYTPAR